MYLDAGSRDEDSEDGGVGRLLEREGVQRGEDVLEVLGLVSDVDAEVDAAVRLVVNAVHCFRDDTEIMACATKAPE